MRPRLRRWLTADAAPILSWERGVRRYGAKCSVARPRAARLPPPRRQRDLRWAPSAFLRSVPEAARENPSLALTSCKQLCRVQAPALFLRLCVEEAQHAWLTNSGNGDGQTPFDVADMEDVFQRYGAQAQREDGPPQSVEGADNGLRPSFFATELGVMWALRESAATSGAVVDTGLVADALRFASQVSGFPPRAVMRLVRLLVQQLESGRLTEDQLTELVSSRLQTACPTHVASIVLGLQCRPPGGRRACKVSARSGRLVEGADAPPTSASEAFPLSRWHPRAPSALAKRCLQVVSDTIREQRGRRSALPLYTLQGLHACAMCALPDGLAPSDPVRTELAILSMSALKYAAYPQLECIYAYLDQQHVVVPAVLNRFLANCGMLLSDADAERRVGTPFDSPKRAPSETVKQAVRAVASSGRDVKFIEEGLVHGCSALAALGCHEEVKAIYRQFPSLRATPHLLVMYVAEGNVADALRVLETLATSRPEGWVRLPPIVHHAVSQVCELVGRCGAPDDVKPLYKSLVAFHNAGMIVSQLVDSVLAGICVRVRRIQADACRGKALPTPRAVSQCVIPITKATLAIVGDDMNTDMLLTLLETALDMGGSTAVPLTTALMGTFRQASSLSIRELFRRLDGSTNGLPFLYYYVLCVSRDRGLFEVVEHLAAAWCVDSKPILLRMPHLAPAYKLWKCAGCHRLNSDRFNYCVCSALRNGFVVCGHCGYGQDERWGVCLCCSRPLDPKTAAGALVRKAWTCASCHAMNPSRQVLLCFRCSRPTGPLFRLHAKGLEADGARREQRSGGNIKGRDHKNGKRKEGPSCCGTCDSGATGYCPGCGRFHSARAVGASFVWRCVGCEQLHSSLERSCPSCPQVDCLPFAQSHKANAVRHCWACGAEEANALAGVCAQCGSDDLRTAAAVFGHGGGPPRQQQPQCRGDSERGATGAAPSAADWVLYCPRCGEAQPASSRGSEEEGETAPCRHCGDALSLRANGVASRQRMCPSCRHELPATVVGTLCPRCSGFVPPPCDVVGEWGAPHVLQTLAMAVMQFRPSTQPYPPSSDAGEASSTNDDTRHGKEECRSELLRLNRFVTELRAAWCAGGDGDSDSDGGGDGAGRKRGCISVATLRAVRPEVLQKLNLLLAHLRPWALNDAVARRAAAQVKQLMTWVDTRCGVDGQSWFNEEEVCHECLGGHPEELCHYYRGPGSDSEAARDGAVLSAYSWVCEECGTSNTNEGIGRYLCTNCVALRPAVQDMFLTECWVCTRCCRANMVFETFCVHCGTQRSTRAASAAAEAANHIPFLPSRCTRCGSVHLEASCPSCTVAPPPPMVAEAEGVVCAVGEHHAYIQPSGSTKAEDRVFVDELLLQGAKLCEGKVVRYLAELRPGDHGASLRATHVR